MSARFFAAKFGYIGATSTAEQFALSAYQPELTATRGDEDYTYSNYFIGRNEFEKYPSQQLLQRGPYKAAWEQYQKDHDLQAYVRGIAVHYATAPNYAAQVLEIANGANVVKALKLARGIFA